MTTSDNLYSAEESDGESFSDELSPSDGYFNRGDRGELGDRRPNIMVPDPSMDDKKVEDKTLIPTPRPQASTGGTSRSSLYPMLQTASSRPYASPPSSENNSSSPTAYTPTSRMSSRRHPSFSEHTPLMNIPPPAYSESLVPSSSSNASQNETPRSPTHTRNDSTYSTFPDHHLEQGFLPPREPESMGGPIDADERTPLSGDKPSPSFRRLIIRKLIFVALVFAIIGSLITAILYSKMPNQHPGQNIPPSNDVPADADGPYCPSATYRRDPVVYEFPVGTDLTVLQITHDNEGGYRSVYEVKTAGEIRLRRIPKDSEHGSQAYFTVDIHVSDPELEVFRSWDEDSRTLKVSTPKYARLNSRKPACVSVQITAWFPEDSEFTDLLIEAISLALRVFEDAKIKVNRRSKFATLSGNIYFPAVNGSQVAIGDIKEPDTPKITEKAELPIQLADNWRSKSEPNHPFSSRRILVETVSGSVHGSYPLLDLLSISTQSGSVSVGVLPQEADKDVPVPADLEVQTISGSIKVDLPISAATNTKFALPARRYISNVHSSSGSISGAYYLGTLGSFKSTSGSIRVKALPVIEASKGDSGPSPSRFETHTVSGTHDIELLDPIFISHLKSIPNQDNQPRPDPYSPVGDDDPYIIMPPTLDRSLVTLDPTNTAKQKLRSVQSKHTSNSASVQVSYPSVWEGTIHAKTVSGGIEVQGKGLRMIKERKGWAGKEVLARKGVEEDGEGSYTEMSDIAGKLDFTVRSPS